MGDIAQGNVSLTISDLTKEDEGLYCCRVEIHGLGNDEIRYIHLEIQDIEECPDDLEWSTIYALN
ncbi:unnamed protein product [Staurois parvus]|uniref:Immunoglobulin V-set domain-containing protein n=1 Tax=Staurois parvus TaxID=386267 RepID=A0ABN9ABY8_9NEOB|nr:unnamed protein product [Staurois parvus]